MTIPLLFLFLVMLFALKYFFKDINVVTHVFFFFGISVVWQAYALLCLTLDMTLVNCL